MKYTLGAAILLLGLGTVPALSASCSGSLTNNCIVIDSDGNFATEGNPNPFVDLRNDNQLGINETFFFFNNQIGGFTTSGDFNVAADFKNPTVVRVTVSEGGAGQFNILDLAFNGGLAQSILNAGTFFFTLVGGANNTFAVTGNANPVFAGPVGYNIALSAIPIPPSLALFATSLIGIGWLGWKRRRSV